MKRYSQPEGCVVCDPAKRNIIWPKEDLPVLGSINAQAIRIIETELEYIEQEQRESLGGKKGMPSKERIGSINQLTRALTGLISEGRKLEDKEESRIRNLSQRERALLLVEAYFELSQEERKWMLDQQVQGERKQLEAMTIEEAELVED